MFRFYLVFRQLLSRCEWNYHRIRSNKSDKSFQYFSEKCDSFFIDEEAFDQIKIWLEEINVRTDLNLKRLLIGNKCDLTEKRTIDYSKAEVNTIVDHMSSLHQELFSSRNSPIL